MIIQQSENIFVQIDVLRKNNSDSNDYWDGNWLEAEIKINTLNFKGFYATVLRADDFQRFYEDLIKLKKGQRKEIQFVTMEEGIFLKCALDMLGKLQWQGIAKPSSEESYLTFFMVTDNAIIDSLILQVEKILDEYPVVGN